MSKFKNIGEHEFKSIVIYKLEKEEDLTKHEEDRIKKVVNEISMVRNRKSSSRNIEFKGEVSRISNNQICIKSEVKITDYGKGRENVHTNIIYIYKKSDDWFYAEVESNEESTWLKTLGYTDGVKSDDYYKCDQFDGLIDLIEYLL